MNAVPETELSNDSSPKSASVLEGNRSLGGGVGALLSILLLALAGGGGAGCYRSVSLPQEVEVVAVESHTAAAVSEEEVGILSDTDVAGRAKALKKEAESERGRTKASADGVCVYDSPRAS